MCRIQLLYSHFSALSLCPLNECPFASFWKSIHHAGWFSMVCWSIELTCLVHMNDMSMYSLQENIPDSTEWIVKWVKSVVLKSVARDGIWDGVGVASVLKDSVMQRTWLYLTRDKCKQHLCNKVEYFHKVQYFPFLNRCEINSRPSFLKFFFFMNPLFWSLWFLEWTHVIWFEECDGVLHSQHVFFFI